jgi:creatinine amidohydrolase
MDHSILEKTMADMTWPEIDEAARNNSIVLLPTGVIEEHGPHMSTAVDINCSYILSTKIQRELVENNIKSLIAPPVYWGININTGSFPGSFSCRLSTFQSLIIDIVDSIKSWGFKFIFNVNWHNDPNHLCAIVESAKKINAKNGICFFTIIEQENLELLNITAIPDFVLISNNGNHKTKSPLKSGYFEIHAESYETSIMKHYFPGQVRKGLARRLPATEITKDDLKAWRKGGDNARRIAPLGYIGNPAAFNGKWGKIIMLEKAKDTASIIEMFLKQGTVNV